MSKRSCSYSGNRVRRSHIYLVDETGSIGEDNLWGDNRQKFYIHGAFRIPANMEFVVREAADKCQRDLGLSTVHMSDLRSFQEKEEVVRWVAKYLKNKPWFYRDTVIERSFYAAALLTDLIFASVVRRDTGLPIKVDNHVYRAAIDLSANSMFGQKLLETFWNAMKTKDPVLLERVLRHILAESKAKADQSVMAEAIYAQIDRFIEEHDLFRTIVTSLLFKHEATSIRSRAFLDVMTDIQLAPHSQPKRIIHDHRDLKDSLDRYLSGPLAPVERELPILEMVEYSADKRDTFLVDVICWISKEYQELRRVELDDRPDNKIRVVSDFLETVKRQGGPPMGSRGISATHSKEMLKRNIGLCNSDRALFGLVGEYCDVREGRISDPFFVDM